MCTQSPAKSVSSSGTSEISCPADQARNLRGLTLGLLIASLSLVGVEAEELGPRPTIESVDFDRDIRPILSDTCFQCHGPDESQRKADYRLDQPDVALLAVEPGDPDASELVRRLTTEDLDERMPPVHSGRRLNPRQIGLIRNWIRQGARWREHWAFVAPRRPRPPRDVTGRVVNPIDRFVLARLSQHGLQQNEEADRSTLIRRVTLDLTGLPPSPADVASFLSNHDADSYEQVVDRLLASPRFGERLALPWLDAARYADTSGYQNDGPRYMWRWRDWVIQAINDNMPFDQFTVEQLAGDLLPNATMDQRMATGFHRNHRGNAEGGIIPEEYAVEYVVDRVETTGTVWLGLTVGCARCHDHKFDPISQREFYEFFAFFNNVPEFGRAIKEGNSPPYMTAPTERQRRKLEQLTDAVRVAKEKVDRLRPQLKAAQRAWEASAPRVIHAWTLDRGLMEHFPLDASPPGATIRQVSGRVAGSLRFRGSDYLPLGDVGNFGYFDEFTLAAWIRPLAQDGETNRLILGRVTESTRGTGYSLSWKDRRLHVNLVKRWLDDAIRVRSKRRLALDQWHHVCVTYDGSRTAAGVRLFLNGSESPLEVELDLLNQSFQTPDPLRVGGGPNMPGLQGDADDLYVFNRVLEPTEIQQLATAESIPAILATDVSTRSVGEQWKLDAFYLRHHAPEETRLAFRELDGARQRRDDYQASLPTVMVMKEADTPKPTFILDRGQYHRRREQVSANTLSCLPVMDPSYPKNRLGLARWITDSKNPLTARVAVNRYWQMLFGVGLVETPEDFGVQGMRPSHPQLLDWLALEFVRSGWDVKALLRVIVTSATYRQSSDDSPDQIAQDPGNRWLGRGPRFRLRAEFVRDHALAASGLLVEQQGGPSVRPYQPEGLWQDIASDKNYQQDEGQGLFRRSLYTYWKRTVAPPSMMTFDASSRETCVVRASRTNTPLQALVVMNDETFLEASRVLAQHALTAAESPLARTRWIFQKITGRRASRAEEIVLTTAVRAYASHYRDHEEAAGQLVRIGVNSVDPSVDGSELAAYTVLASLVFNLDESLTKQ